MSIGISIIVILFSAFVLLACIAWLLAECRSLLADVHDTVCRIGKTTCDIGQIIITNTEAVDDINEKLIQMSESPDVTASGK
jgi:hypothetical protein